MKQNYINTIYATIREFADKAHIFFLAKKTERTAKSLEKLLTTLNASSNALLEHIFAEKKVMNHADYLFRLNCSKYDNTTAKYSEVYELERELKNAVPAHSQNQITCVSVKEEAAKLWSDRKVALSELEEAFQTYLDKSEVISGKELKKADLDYRRLSIMDAVMHLNLAADYLRDSLTGIIH